MASPSWFRNSRALAAGLLVGLGLAGCRTPAPDPVVVAAPAPAPKAVVRDGDEIVVAGRLFPTGARVVTWMDPGGYDAYRGEWRMPAAEGNSTKLFTPQNYGERLTAPKGPPVRRDLAGLRECVDQFVLHYDECGLSKLCFDVLQKRNLSVHFLLDVDGTIYQTLDLQERAWHATTANDRSIGVEIANLGARPPGDTKIFAEWYQRGPAGQTRLVPPLAIGNPRIRTLNFTARPQRPDPVRGQVQGRELVQYDLTPEQYAALIKLTAALHRAFPRLKIDCPRDAAGAPVRQKLSDRQLAKFQGVLGHYHIQENKVDPGPAFQWDAVIDGARRLAGEPVRKPAPPSVRRKGRP